VRWRAENCLGQVQHGVVHVCVRNAVALHHGSESVGVHKATS
jgi:hypothetical protein